MSPVLYNLLESCTIAQGYCRKTLDHKPIFLNLKKKRSGVRAVVYNGTVDNVLSENIVKISVHRSYLLSAAEESGPATAIIINRELDKIKVIENKVNRIVFLQGTAYSRDLLDMEELELNDLLTTLPADWLEAAPLDYIRTFERQVNRCDFFELLLENARRGMLTFQKNIKTAESLAKKSWTNELVRLKAGGYAMNFDRICELEKKLNDASEKFIAERLGNYIKQDTLNSEKMTPRFLRIAKDNNVSDLSIITNDDGTPFLNQDERSEHVTGFYESLYKIPETVPENFTDCVTEFLGDLVNHPAIRGCMLNEEEKIRLEADVTIGELDEAVEKINLGSAPGIDGLNNRFIKKFWNFFRIPLYEYTVECIANKKLTGTFRTALIRLIPKKATQKKLKTGVQFPFCLAFTKLFLKP